MQQAAYGGGDGRYSQGLQQQGMPQQGMPQQGMQQQAMPQVGLHVVINSQLLLFSEARFLQISPILTCPLTYP